MFRTKWTSRVLLVIQRVEPGFLPAMYALINSSTHFLTNFIYPCTALTTAEKSFSLPIFGTIIYYIWTIIPLYIMHLKLSFFTWCLSKYYLLKDWNSYNFCLFFYSLQTCLMPGFCSLPSCLVRLHFFLIYFELTEKNVYASVVLNLWLHHSTRGEGVHAVQHPACPVSARFQSDRWGLAEEVQPEIRLSAVALDGSRHADVRGLIQVLAGHTEQDS